MRHRHLINDHLITPPAVADIIERGLLPDWKDLMQAMKQDPQVAPMVMSLCSATIAQDPEDGNHRYHLWRHLVDAVAAGLREHPREEASLEALRTHFQRESAQQVIEAIEVASGSLNGIETGIRQFIRSEPLECEIIDAGSAPLHVPTMGEMLRIKGYLILRCNRIRDYIDFCVLFDGMGKDRSLDALSRLDDLYPQKNGQSPLLQLAVQCANPTPGDLKQVGNLSQYRDLPPPLCSWNEVKETLPLAAVYILIDATW